MGTTGLGAVDPLDQILSLRMKYDFRIHADSAYGGYFRLADSLDSETQMKFEQLSKVDSIVIDPHKHGLQPYGCGCVLFKDRNAARHYLHDSPYTYFTSDDLHLGEISLECSRAGASAVGLWATHRLLPPEIGGEFAISLNKCRQAALQLADKIQGHDEFKLILSPELDIVVWAVKGETAAEMSDKAERLFNECADRDLHLSMLRLEGEQFGLPEGNVTCLRCCLMKPEHLDWIEKIWDRLIKNPPIKTTFL